MPPSAYDFPVSSCAATDRRRVRSSSFFSGSGACFASRSAATAAGSGSGGAPAGQGCVLDGVVPRVSPLASYHRAFTSGSAGVAGSPTTITSEMRPSREQNALPRNPGSQSVTLQTGGDPSWGVSLLQDPHSTPSSFAGTTVYGLP